MENASTLTMHLSRDLIAKTQQYAAQHQTTVTELIAAYLRYVTRQEALPGDMPILQRLSGILPADVSTEGYERYLVEKYDG